MGLLDNVLGSALGSVLGQGQAQPSQAGGANGGLMAALLPIALSMLQGQQGGSGLGGMLGGVLGGNQAQAGGLGGLLNQFQQAGLGDQVASWVGTGQNLPISAGDIGKVLGNDTLANIAQQAGVSQGDASAGLAQLLPHLIDHLTPNGQMPEGGQLQAGLGSLLKQFGNG